MCVLSFHLCFLPFYMKRPVFEEKPVMWANEIQSMFTLSSCLLFYFQYRFPPGPLPVAQLLFGVQIQIMFLL